jgi:hypothetical protein
MIFIIKKRIIVDFYLKKYQTKQLQVLNNEIWEYS